ncbi:AT-rich interactive domain-containing protein 5A isoform X2 [Lepus europaeus]|uniref:AT-rich interactive domain-containing protein 5A isoform X2 n=1 Tax=Lepus europaeus TaxID=9983 RepID=UPI002B45E314|nr:AT-rich interactive domain-containing protein 5A isoform X2 [Lepus europaeus]
MAPPVKGKRKQSEEGDPLDPPASPKPCGEHSRSQSPVGLEDSPETGGEREEEQAFLVSLYKFMKERHTPIERVPHLGFKQINLWKIYKAVEKLGAYELVTGRRLWKNVYDELGGSPGSTSAATCTRRHYERLVLPYVRHLKGEDDKPLPSSEPRKQYKVAKDSRGGDRAPERPKKAAAAAAVAERQVDQVMPGKTKADATELVRFSSQEPPRDSTEQLSPAPGPALPYVGASSCPEAYKRLLSSFYCKGTHGIMSPLAKKKLLAQVSKAGALQCQEEGCRHGAGGPSGEPQGTPVFRLSESPRSPSRPPENSGHRLSPQEGPQAPGGSPREEAQAGPVVTGCFHAYPAEVLKPVSQHPKDFFASLKDPGVLLGPPGQEEGPPAREPRPMWGGDASRPSAFHRGSSARGSFYPKPKACWVSPMAKAPAESPVPPPAPRSSPGLGSKRSLEDEGFARAGKKLRAVSPFLNEADAKEGGAKAAGGVAVSCLLGPALGPAPPEAYRGATLRCPLSFACAPDPVKGQLALPFSPLVIPAFPAHFLATAGPSPMAAGLMPFPPAALDGALRHRLGPAPAAWPVPPVATYAAPHFFHLNTKL